LNGSLSGNQFTVSLHYVSDEESKDCVFIFCQLNDKDLEPTIAVQLAKEKQALREADGDVVKEQDLIEENVEWRKTIHNIEASNKRCNH
jgi:hypothetical protein